MVNAVAQHNGGTPTGPADDSGPTGADAVFATGVEALVHGLLVQHEADAVAGLRTATFASGYQGSPLGGFDKELARRARKQPDTDVILQPAINEELGATAVWGTQLVGNLPDPRYDGVVGVWYGKAPGLERAADAIRHGNFVGAAPTGGAIALVGDDPACKSSTIPSASEQTLAALGVPVLVPANVQEAADYVRHAVACSRASGLWVAMKIVAAVADGTGTISLDVDRVAPIMPRLEWEGSPYVHRPSAHLVAPQSLEMERTMRTVRLDLAKLYARENDLNTTTADGADARIGIIASGAVHSQVSEALDELGLAGSPLIRVLKLGMVYPLDEQVVQAHAADLDEILVIEEKGPFVERLVKDCLYGTPDAPRVLGHRDATGRELVPVAGALDVVAVARIIGRRVLELADVASVRARLDELDAIAARPAAAIDANRTAFFCSGCPHNSSTVADDDTVVGAGIGCHSMVMLKPTGHGRVQGLTQMGGEGAQWIGAAPFVGVPHFVQNIGDGTFHHSGSLAVRAAIAAKLNVTYKILYNDTVAMTGGQHVEGQLSVPDLARLLAAEGVKKVVVTTDDVEQYRTGVNLPPIASVEPRSRLRRVQRELAAVPGVTVLIHDQGCAAELRRARSRGTAPDPPQEVIINERVCEGCGDCGEKSGCLSVEPVETEFGRKTRIHQGSCNKDYSCLNGDCPAFLTIVPSARTKAKPSPTSPTALPDPPRRNWPATVNLRLVGIGGTGVVSVSHALGKAAALDGKQVVGLDQTGMSQKAGPVVSDLRISDADIAVNSVGAGRADVLLGFDILGTADPANLRVADPDRTIAVVSTTKVPTGEMVVRRDAPGIDVAAATAAIDGVTRAGENAYVDARAVAEQLFGDHMQTNNLLLGVAWQAGAVPLTREAMHLALRRTPADDDPGVVAFEWGRACIAAPDQLPTAFRKPEKEVEPLPELDALAPEEGEFRRSVTVRAADLQGWQSRRVAERYVAELMRVKAVEEAAVPGSTVVTESVARGLHKLMAYKDEYEVARLHLDGLAELPVGASVKFHLHPPLFRALGLSRKIKVGAWFIPAFRTLRRARALRGTPFDVFGYSRMRRLERDLPREYLTLVDQGLDRLTEASLSSVRELAELPDCIRGYEDIKLAGVAQFRERASTLLASLDGVADSPITVHQHQGAN